MGMWSPRSARSACPSPAGDVAHDGDTELGVQVDAVGDAGGDDYLGKMDGVRQGPEQDQGEEEGMDALELHLLRHPSHPGGDRATHGCVPTGAGAALGTVMSSMGMGMGSLAANLWLSSFTM